MNFQEVMSFTPLRQNSSYIYTVFSNIRDSRFEAHPVARLLEESDFKEEQATRFKVSIYADSGDDKYGVTIGVLFFDETPCIGFTISGRYGGDVDTYPFDEELFEQAIAYLKTFLEEPKRDYLFKNPSEVELGSSIGGVSLDTLLQSGFSPEYSPEDVVWAWAPENHLKYEYSKGYKGLVLVRARIEKLEAHSIYDTFRGSQLDRSWNDQREMAYLPGKTMGCTLSQYLILGKVSDIKQEPEMSFYQKVNAQGCLDKDYFVDYDTAFEYTQQFKAGKRK